MLKKVLILAYDFPPYTSVGGLRPYSWYTYFKEFGIEPIVVTRQWDNKYGNHLDYVAPGMSTETLIEKSEFGIILKTPYKPNLANRILLKYGESRLKLLRRGISAFYEHLQFIFFIGSKSRLFYATGNYVEKNNIALIIATGEPFVLFKYASYLSKKFDIPWVADYRDPWTQDDRRRENIIIKKWDAFFEKKYLENVSAITTVSMFFQKHIQSMITGKPFHIIPNGYDPEIIERLPKTIQNSEKLSISFVGTIYQWHPIESFIRTLSKFITQNENPLIQVNFFGINKDNFILNLLDSSYPHLNAYITFSSKLPNDILLSKIAADHVFLLFNDYSILGTKIYDYLALKRLILFCFSDDPEAAILKMKYYNMEEFDSESNQLQIDVIKETNSGIIVKDSKHLYKVLEQLYAEFTAKGFIECNSVNTEQFSRKIQVEKLAGIINNIVNEKQSIV